MAKDKDYIKMIHTARWVRLRRDKLTDCPLCERCKKEGRVSAATEVHHVVPVEVGLTRSDKERLMFDSHNLRALCHNCHVLTHTEMGRGGKEHNKSRAREHLNAFAERFIGGTINKHNEDNETIQKGEAGICNHPTDYGCGKVSAE